MWTKCIFLKLKDLLGRFVKRFVEQLKDLMGRLAPPRLYPDGRDVSAATRQRKCHRQAGKTKHWIKVFGNQ